jgi:transposase-like protein
VPPPDIVQRAVVTGGTAAEADATALASLKRANTPCEPRCTTAQWQDDAEAFTKRSLKDIDYVYVWVDGIVRQPRDK